MLKYKSIAMYLLLYFIIIFIFAISVNSIDITVENLYFNIYLFVIILLIYYTSMNLSQQLPLQLYRYVDITMYYKDALKHFTFLNFFISSCIFISNWFVVFLFGSFSYTYKSELLYFIHIFIIFEIIFLALLCFVHNSKFILKSSILFSVIFAMYLMCVLNNNTPIFPTNLFLYFFSTESTNQLFSIVYYVIWIMGIILLLKFKERNFEI